MKTSQLDIFFNKKHFSVEKLLIFKEIPMSVLDIIYQWIRNILLENLFNRKYFVCKYDRIFPYERLIALKQHRFGKIIVLFMQLYVPMHTQTIS